MESIMINETIKENKDGKIFIRIEDSLKKIIEERAKHEGRSLSNYIRRVLKEEFKKDNR